MTDSHSSISSFVYEDPPTHRVLLPKHSNASSSSAVETHPNVTSKELRTPLIICFHGSGETCSPSWDDLAARLVGDDEMQCRVLLYDRGPGNPRPTDVATEMWDYVLGGGTGGTMDGATTNRTGEDGRSSKGNNDLRGPYILIAHSYGGAFAREFVQREDLMRSRRRWGWGVILARNNIHTNIGTSTDTNDDDDARNYIMGLVLVETGQEGGLTPAFDEKQIKDVIMGDRPVCVVRGNSLLGKWKELEAKERAEAARASGKGDDGTSLEKDNGSGGDAKVRQQQQQQQILAAEREMLMRIDAEDERLKRRQLGLSRTSRFVQLPDCGHDVILQRPRDVVDAVRWVLENVEGAHPEDEDGKWVRAWKGLLERVRRFRFW